MHEHDTHEADMQRYLAADNDDDEVLLDPQIRELESAQVAEMESRLASGPSSYVEAQHGAEKDFSERDSASHMRPTGYRVPAPSQLFDHNNDTQVAEGAKVVMPQLESGSVQETPKISQSDESWSAPTNGTSRSADQGRDDGKADTSLPGTPTPDQEDLIIGNCPSSSSMTPTSQLQTMADLLHRHQMKQIERSRRSDASDEVALQPSEQDLTQEKTTDHVQNETAEPAAVHMPESSTAGPSSPGSKSPNATVIPVSGSSTETGDLTHTVLGKRKDRPYSTSIPDEEANSTSMSGVTSDPDGLGVGSNPVDDNGKKRRAARKRKPVAESSSKSSGSKAGKPPPPVPQAQRLKRESRRRWTSLEPYITLMMMLLRTLLGQQGWLVLVEGVAKVSPPDEQKDLGRIKQTWANEYTRLKSRRAKGRLVTLRDLSCSWPWNMEEKKQLWLTGIELCVQRADWDAVAAEVNKSAKAVGEPEVTTDVCRAEWDNVLKYEYTDDEVHDAEPGYDVQVSTLPSTTTQTVPQRSMTHLTSLVDPEVERDHSSTTLRMSHLEPVPSSLLDTRSTYHFALNDYVNADITTPRLGDLFVGDAGDPRPVNRPLQVQPPRPEDLGTTEEDPLGQGFELSTSKGAPQEESGSRREGEVGDAGSMEQVSETMGDGESSAQQIPLGMSLAPEVEHDPAS